MSGAVKLLLGEAGVEIIDGDRGANYPSKSELLSIGHCLFLSAANVTIDGFSLQQSQFISQARDEKLRKGKLQRFDSVLTTRGTVGNVAFFNASIPHDNVRINSGMVILRPDPKIVDPRYLYIFLRSELFSAQVKELTSGSAQPQLPIRDIRYIEMPLPPLTEQGEIAAILGALDDKIEVNRKASATLEEMARALYRSWFVDFDPVWAKLEGRQPAHMDAVTAALFPDRFDDDGLPVGWKRARVSDLFDVTMGQSPPGHTYNDVGDGLPFFQGRTDFGFRYPTNRKFCSAPSRTATPESVLLSVRAPVGDLNKALETCCIGRGVAALAEKNCLGSFGFYTMWSLSDALVAFDSEGTVFGSINRKQLLDLTVIASPEAIRAEFEKIVSPWDDRLRELTLESRTLAALRDTLLPRLMSGELRVGEARELVEEVA